MDNASEKEISVYDPIEQTYFPEKTADQISQSFASLPKIELTNNLKIRLLSPFLYNVEYKEKKLQNWTEYVGLLPICTDDTGRPNDKCLSTIELFEKILKELIDFLESPDLDALMVLENYIKHITLLDEAILKFTNHKIIVHLKAVVSDKNDFSEKQVCVAIFLAVYHYADLVIKFSDQADLFEKFKETCPENAEEVLFLQEKLASACDEKIYCESLNVVPLNPLCSHTLYCRRALLCMKKAQTGMEEYKVKDVLLDAKRCLCLKSNCFNGFYLFVTALNLLERTEEALKHCTQVFVDYQSNDWSEPELAQITQLIQCLKKKLTKVADEKSNNLEASGSILIESLTATNDGDKSNDNIQGNKPELEKKGDSEKKVLNKEITTVSQQTKSHENYENLLEKNIGETYSSAGKNESISECELKIVSSSSLENDQDALVIHNEIKHLMSDGSDAKLQERNHSACQAYTKCLHLIAKHDIFMLDMDLVILKYACGIAFTEIGLREELQKALKLFQDIIINHNTVTFPLTYYGLGKVYFKQNRFKEAIEQFTKALSIIKKGHINAFAWPETVTLIEESNSEKLEILLEELLKQCQAPHFPDAICRFQQCKGYFKTEIYYSDPDFIGLVTLLCTEGCKIDFHPECWKICKIALHKLHDKRFKDFNCFTPDCLGTILKIIYRKSDATLRKEIVFDITKNKKQSKGTGKFSMKINCNKNVFKEKKDKKKPKKRVKNKDQVIEIKEIPSESFEHSPPKKPVSALESQMVCISKKDQEEDNSMLLKGKSIKPDKHKDKKKKMLLDLDFIQQANYIERHSKNTFSDYFQCDETLHRNKESVKEYEIIDAVVTFFQGILFEKGPLYVNDSILLEEAANLPLEAKRVIESQGGLATFLCNYSTILIGDYLCLPSDINKAINLISLTSKSVNKNGVLTLNSLDDFDEDFIDVNNCNYEPKLLSPDYMTNDHNCMNKKSSCNMDSNLSSFYQLKGDLELVSLPFDTFQIDMSCACGLKVESATPRAERSSHEFTCYSEIDCYKNIREMFSHLYSYKSLDTTTKASILHTLSYYLCHFMYSKKSFDSAKGGNDIGNSCSKKPFKSYSQLQKENEDLLLKLQTSTDKHNKIVNKLENSLEKASLYLEDLSKRTEKIQIDSKKWAKQVNIYEEEIKGLKGQISHLQYTYKESTLKHDSLTASNNFIKMQFMEESSKRKQLEETLNFVENKFQLSTEWAQKAEHQIFNLQKQLVLSTLDENLQRCKTNVNYYINVSQCVPDFEIIQTLERWITLESQTKENITLTKMAFDSLFEEVECGQSLLNLPSIPLPSELKPPPQPDFGNVLKQMMTKQGIILSSTVWHKLMECVFQLKLGGVPQTFDGTPCKKTPEPIQFPNSALSPKELPILSVIKDKNVTEAINTYSTYNIYPEKANRKESSNTSQIVLPLDAFASENVPPFKDGTCCKKTPEPIQFPKSALPSKELPILSVIKDKNATEAINTYNMYSEKAKRKDSSNTSQIVLPFDAFVSENVPPSKEEIHTQNPGNLNTHVESKSRIIPPPGLELFTNLDTKLTSKYLNPSLPLSTAKNPKQNHSDTVINKVSSLISAKKPMFLSKPKLNNFDRLLDNLCNLLPTHSRNEIAQFIIQLRQSRNNTLSGLTANEIIVKVLELSSVSKQENLIPSSNSKLILNSICDRDQIRSPKEDFCVICHDELSAADVTELDCHHTFHKQCIRQWLHKDSTCPMCRTHALMPDEYPAL